MYALISAQTRRYTCSLSASPSIYNSEGHRSEDDVSVASEKT